MQLDVNCDDYRERVRKLTDYIEMWIVSPVRGTSNYFIDVMGPKGRVANRTIIWRIVPYFQYAKVLYNLTKQ